jgi:hypothetical protein
MLWPSGRASRDFDNVMARETLSEITRDLVSQSRHRGAIAKPHRNKKVFLPRTPERIRLAGGETRIWAGPTPELPPGKIRGSRSPLRSSQPLRRRPQLRRHDGRPRRVAGRRNDYSEARSPPSWAASARTRLGLPPSSSGRRGSPLNPQSSILNPQSSTLA